MVQGALRAFGERSSWGVMLSINMGQVEARGRGGVMEKPDLHRVWETYIRVQQGEHHIEVLRSKVSPLIFDLQSGGIIGWYCLTVPRRPANTPPHEYRIRLEILVNVKDKEEVNSLLTEYCEKGRTRAFLKVDPPDQISGIDNTLLLEEDITEAWKVIGEGSEWILRMLEVHKEDAVIYPQQIAQYLHFFSNVTGFGVF